MPAQTGRTNGFATAGLICSLLAWMCCCCFPFNLFGLVFSLIALIQINARPDLYEGRTIAIAGLILSGLNLLWCFGFTLLQLAMSPPNVAWHLGRLQ